MCGIIGVFGRKQALKLAKTGLAVLKYRGEDAVGFYRRQDLAIGHCLHSVVGRVKQPLLDRDVFASNCEVYNWQELNRKYKFKAQNDSELLFKLLQKKGIKALDELDGVYAFAFLSKNKLFLARDIIGVKPIWYCHSNGFYFASEKKALEKLGLIDINELNPRKILVYDLKNDSLTFIERQFFSIKNEIKESVDVIARKLELLIKNAVSKRIPKRKFGILFSGGIDSTAIALILKQMKQKFTCYTAVIDDPALKEPEDLTFAKKVAKEFELDLSIIKIKPAEIEKQLKTIVPLIEDSNVVKVEVALTFFAACRQAHKDGCKVLFSGLGSEEIFAGYQRHKDSFDINKECLSGLLKLYERDLYRDDVITMYNKIEARLPFLDKKLVEYSLQIPGKYKLNEHEKYILRVVAKNIGLKDEFAMRKKKAAQYGSNVSKAIKKLAKRSGKSKSEYLRKFYPRHNLRLGALASSGKDSIFALYIMLKQNYSVDCLISIQSENPDSYMFHTPNISLVKLQSKSMGIPLVIGKTKGNKEEELNDLKKTIAEAKRKYKLDGIITGALFSTYQRDRIEKTCDSLSLKIFSPLWHMNQETEMRELLENNFRIVFSSVAAFGLNKSWLGREITQKHVDALAELNEKIGINIAGEGGEFESLVLDCPLFSKRLKIISSRIVEDNENTAKFIVEKVQLESKH